VVTTPEVSARAHADRVIGLLQHPRHPNRSSWFSNRVRTEKMMVNQEMLAGQRVTDILPCPWSVCAQDNR